MTMANDVSADGIEPAVLEQEADAIEETQESEASHDWKAAYEALVAQHGKTESDLRALRGTRVTEDQRTNLLQTALDKMDAQERRMDALIKAMASGETDALPEQVAQMDSQAAQTRGQRAFSAQYTSLYGDLREAVEGPNGEPLLDIQTAPELDGMRSTWSQAYNSADMPIGDRLALFTKAIGEATRVTRKVERERHQAELLKTKGAAKATRKQLLDEVDALDLDTGSGTGGAGSSDAQFLERYSTGAASSKADHARASQILKNL